MAVYENEGTKSAMKVAKELKGAKSGQIYMPRDSIQRQKQVIQLYFGEFFCIIARLCFTFGVFFPFYRKN